MTDSLVLVFRYLDVKDVCNASLVCKTWNASANYSGLWSSLCLLDHRFVVSTDDLQTTMLSPKEFYQEKYRIWTNVINKIYTPTLIKDRLEYFVIVAAQPPYLLLKSQAQGVVVWDMDKETVLGSTNPPEVNRSGPRRRRGGSTRCVTVHNGYVIYDNQNRIVVTTIENIINKKPQIADKEIVNGSVESISLKDGYLVVSGASFENNMDSESTTPEETSNQKVAKKVRTAEGVPCTLLSFPSLEVLYTWTPHNEEISVTKVFVNSDSVLIATGSRDGTVKLLNKLPTSSHTETFTIGGLIQSIELTSRVLIACTSYGSDNKSLCVYDLPSGKERYCLQNVDRTYWCVQYEPKTNIAWAGSSGGVLTRIDLNTNSHIHFPYVHHLSKWHHVTMDIQGLYFDDNRVITQYGNNQLTKIDFTPQSAWIDDAPDSGAEDDPLCYSFAVSDGGDGPVFWVTPNIFVPVFECSGHAETVIKATPGFRGYSENGFQYYGEEGIPERIEYSERVERLRSLAKEGRDVLLARGLRITLKIFISEGMREDLSLVEDCGAFVFE